MIAVDTSALMAVLLDEPLAQDCADALQAAGPLMISAGTLAEALIVADRRGLGAEMRRLSDGSASRWQRGGPGRRLSSASVCQTLADTR